MDAYDIRVAIFFQYELLAACTIWRHCGIISRMSTRFKYFPPDSTTKKWGLYLCDVGWQQTSLEEDYPIKKHPDGYYYTWETGRRLAEYQLGLVFSGKGVMKFERGKPIPLSSGMLFLLAPGQWHRCRPDAKTGWGTLWLGFHGNVAQAMMRTIFHTDGCAIKPIAKAKEFKYAAMRFIASAFKHGELKPFSTIGDLALLLGQLADGVFDATNSPKRIDVIRNAQLEITKRYTETINFQSLAESFGLSYDAFRHRFVAETGHTPLQFLLSERLRTAKNLVANSNMPIKEIAASTGFVSAAYFTRFFKNATGMPPQEYRQAQSIAD